MKNVKKIITAIMAAAICLFSFGGCAVWNQSVERVSNLTKYDFVYSTIQKYYIEDVTLDDLIKYGVNGVLDKYSAYYTAEEYAERLSSLEGNREALGVVIENTESGAKIVNVSGNSPAESAGLLAEDLIVGVKDVGGEEYRAVSSTEGNYLVDLISGYGKDVEFMLKIVRGGEILEKKVSKKEYVENYVWYEDSTGYYKNVTDDGENWSLDRVSDATKGLSENTGYLKLSSFNGDATAQFSNAMKKFKSNGNKNIIIDLRGNGGGLLSILTKLCSHFISDGNTKKLEVTTAIFKDESTQSYYTSESLYSGYGFENIVVLADENSASASEAFIGALMDYDAQGANIVKVIVTGNEVDGQTVYRTYGKGIMQSTFENSSDGSALKLTTAKIYWPLTDTCIHGVGITPETDTRVTGVADISSETDEELTAAIALVA